MRKRRALSIAMTAKRVSYPVTSSDLVFANLGFRGIVDRSDALAGPADGPAWRGCGSEVVPRLVEL